MKLQGKQTRVAPRGLRMGRAHQQHRTWPREQRTAENQAARPFSQATRGLACRIGHHAPTCTLRARLRLAREGSHSFVWAQTERTCGAPTQTLRARASASRASGIADRGHDSCVRLTMVELREPFSDAQ